MPVCVSEARQYIGYSSPVLHCAVKPTAVHAGLTAGYALPKRLHAAIDHPDGPP